ncbi:MAG: hypothetical protein EBR62_00280 [Verrucomicrobia bacterium]|nr:hypothetical protein [Verrucomicrobiota bacterium]
MTDATEMERTYPALVRHGSLFQPSALGYRFVWNDGEAIERGQNSDLAVLERGRISHTLYDFSLVGRS